MRFPTAVRHDPAIDDWLRAHPGPLGKIAERWFETMRACGEDVRELLHDGHPTACVGDAAFAYVNAFTAHVNVGFFLGVHLPDPDGVLQGAGNRGRFVRLTDAAAIDSPAIVKLLRAAVDDAESPFPARGRGRTIIKSVSAKQRARRPQP